MPNYLINGIECVELVKIFDQFVFLLAVQFDDIALRKLTGVRPWRSLRHHRIPVDGINDLAQIHKHDRIKQLAHRALVGKWALLQHR